MNMLAVILWTYFVGWHLIGGMLIIKAMPNHPNIAKLLGSFVGFFAGAIFSLVVFHL